MCVLFLFDHDFDPDYQDLWDYRDYGENGEDRFRVIAIKRFGN